jgi:hypothetical protein
MPARVGRNTGRSLSPCTPDFKVVERILFVFAKLNGRFYVQACCTDVGSWQGMNEILGLLYFVFATDAAPEWLPHVEADAFFCFMAIMATPNFRECFFKNVDDTTAGVGSLPALLHSPQQASGSVLTLRCPAGNTAVKAHNARSSCKQPS